jgi:ribonuclease-3
MQATNPSDADKKVARVEQIIGHTFSDPLRGATALHMAGNLTVVQGDFRQLELNTLLAVLGDSILDAVLCKMWYGARDAQGMYTCTIPHPPEALERQRTKQEPGKRLTKNQWSIIRHQQLGNDNLARVGRRFGIDACIIAAGGTDIMSDRMVATTVEAIFGAVFLDGDREAVRAVVARLGLANHTLLQVMLHPSLVPLYLRFADGDRCANPVL